MNDYRISIAKRLLDFARSRGALVPAKCGESHKAAKKKMGRVPVMPTVGRPATGSRMPLRLTRKTPCKFFGELQSECPVGDETRNIHHCDCEKKESTRCWRSPLISTDEDVASCDRCREYVVPSDGIQHEYGVVIGSYGMPGLIELQVRMIRRTCGSVPILIVDDCSDGYGHTPDPISAAGRLRNIAASNEGVTLFVHPYRFGHASGDLSKFWTGIQWAKSRNLKVVAALSQRMLIEIENWLQNGAKRLLASGLPVASCRAVEGRTEFDIRSEAVLIEVDKWYHPEILDMLMPRALNFAGETLIWNTIVRYLGGEMDYWPILHPDRYKKAAGILWHLSNTKAEYEEASVRYGVRLGPEFSTLPWREIQGKTYKS